MSARAHRSQTSVSPRGAKNTKLQKIGAMIGEAMAKKVNEDKARIESARKKAEEQKKDGGNGEALIAINSISSDSGYCPNIEVELMKRE